MKPHRGIGALLGALLLGAVGMAQASLVGILPTTAGGTNYQAYYDSTTNLTWLANANMNGPMNWSAANTWADTLSITGYNSSGQQVTVGGWTLPSITDTGTSGCNYGFSGTDCGFNVQTTSGSTVYSAMASLYYDTLGNKGYCDTSGNCPQAGWGLTNTSPFTNVQSYDYWSATEYAPGSPLAWYFGFKDGSQGLNFKTNILYAWAVHSGDVGAPPTTGVPEPGVLGLMGMAIVGTAVALRRSTLRQSA